MKIIGIGSPTSAIASPSGMFRSAVQRWQRPLARLFDPYRPELHYMRGPGPKCREKQALAERGR